VDGVTAFDKHADEYDRWFDENKQIYQAEVNALQRLVPQTGFGIEVGVGRETKRICQMERRHEICFQAD